MKITNGLRGLMLTVAASVATAGSAMAADIGPIMPEATAPMAPAPAPSFGWAGPYAGIASAVQFCGGFCWVNVDGHAGYNMVFGSVLLGVEGQVGYWFDPPGDGWFLGATGRVGYVFGNAVAYAKAGIIGYFPVTVDFYMPLNVGVEVAIGRAISLFAEAGAQWEVGSNNFFPSVGLGVNFHIGH
jgi:hypothetical protein